MNLRPLLAPRSIAVVGANDRPGSYADNVLQNLARSGFEGPVWGVNPKRAGSTVHGRECVAGLLDLPEPVDAVAVAIPAAGVPAAIRDAGARGCGGAVVVSAGFGEIEAGRGLEEELRRSALAAELPVCGPNGNGIVSAPARASIWGDSVPPLDPGGVAMVSQSGNLAVNALGSRRGIRWHTLVSSGNETVCDASDWLAAVCELDGVRSVAMFCESDGDGARLAEALAVAAERRIGVAVLKVGASAAGAGAAAAHTGSLAGDQRVFRALVEEAGAAWARDPHELLEMARALAEPRARPRGGGAAVLTCSGGDSGVAADEAERAGVELPPLAPATREALAALLPHAATITNPLDYTAMIWGDAEALRKIVVAVGADPAIGQLLMIYDHPRDLAPESEAQWMAVRAGIVAGAAETEAATLVAATLPDLIDEAAIDELAAHGVPAIAGLTTALACARELCRPWGDPARLREIAAAARLAHPARNQGDGWLAEVEAKELLRAGGVSVPPGRVAADADDAVAAAGEIGWPVAMKLSAPALLHKSDAGAIALGLGDEAAVREADRRLRSLPVAAGAQILVERMAPSGVEVFVAARADGVVPALAIGLGGIWAEAFDDVAIVPLPASAERVEEALRSLRAAALLTGERGSQPVDVGALAALAARAGELALERRLALLELNPVAAGTDGATALDAVAMRA